MTYQRIPNSLPKHFLRLGKCYGWNSQTPDMVGKWGFYSCLCYSSTLKLWLFAWERAKDDFCPLPGSFPLDSSTVDLHIFYLVSVWQSIVSELYSETELRSFDFFLNFTHCASALMYSGCSWSVKRAIDKCMRLDTTEWWNKGRQCPPSSTVQCPMQWSHFYVKITSKCCYHFSVLRSIRAVVCWGSSKRCMWIGMNLASSFTLKSIK